VSQQEHPELAPEEYYRLLEVGLSTLRDQCMARNESDTDAELAARLIQLWELRDFGFLEETALLPSPKLRNYTVGKIARICAALLRRVADEKREELGDRSSAPN
jgi:hypothetical protein